MISNGIDLGDRSLAVVSVELDDEGIPLKLRAQSLLLHDGGVIDEQYKVSRIAKRGNARRTRRRFARRRKRPVDLRKTLIAAGFPAPATDELPPHPSDEVVGALAKSSVGGKLHDGQFPWFARRALLTKINDEEQAKLLFAIAALHIDRHRGWRNPWQTVDSMLRTMRGDDGSLELSAGAKRWFLAASERFSTDVRSYGECGALAVENGQAVRLNKRVAGRLGGDAIKIGAQIKKSKGPDDLVPILHEFAVPVRPFQQDLAYELFQIGEIQGFDRSAVETIVKAVFDQEKPGFNPDVIGDCPLIEGQKRAASYLPSVQEWKIRGFVANLRATEPDGTKRRLSIDEQNFLTEKLSTEKERNKVRWGSLEDWLNDLNGSQLKINRNKRKGAEASGSTDEDEGSVETSRHPIIDSINALVLKNGSEWRTFRDWWKDATFDDRELLLKSLDAASHDGRNESDPATEFRDRLLEEEAFDSEHFETFVEKIPDGRVAYSAEAITKMLPYMREGADLYEARKEAFGLEETWAPPGPTWEEPGMKNHPVLQVVRSGLNKSLGAIDSEIGVADFVRVEAARRSMTLKTDRQALSNFAKEGQARNIAARENIEEHGEKTSRGRIRAARIIADQNNQCAYELACSGTTLSLDNTELDHIIPRSVGAGNPRKNMVACCADCNRKKGDRAYGSLVDEGTLEKTIERMRSWQLHIFSPDLPRDMERILRAKSENDVDLRSPTPTSQVATQICNMLADRYSHLGPNETICESVNAAIGAEARKTAGWKKSRTDHRHHVVDAAIVACVNSKVIPFLRERQAMRDYAYNFRKGSPRHEELMAAAKDYGMNQDYFNRWVAGLTSIVNELRELLDRDEEPTVGDDPERDEPIDSLDAVVPRRPIRLKALSQNGNGVLVASDPLHLETASPVSYKPLGALWTKEEVFRVADRDLHVSLRKVLRDTGKELPPDANRVASGMNGEVAADQLVAMTDLIPQVIVRDAVHAIGSVHHLRIYEYEGAKGVRRDAVPIYHFDVVQALREETDLNSDRRATHVNLHPGAVSLRSEKPGTVDGLRGALDQGQPVKMIGWIAPGDEIVVDDLETIAWYPSEDTPETWKRVRRTYVTGFAPRNGRLNLLPLIPGWPDPRDAEELGIKLNKNVRGLLTFPKLDQVTVVRRDSLGRVKSLWRPYDL
jgi:CRISPR-associated endonuclease Csn1